MGKSLHSKAVKLAAASLALIAFGVGPAAATPTPSPQPVGSPTASVSATPATTPTSTPSPTPVPIIPAAPNTCSAKAALGQKVFPRLYVYAFDVTTGRTLINLNGTAQTPSASVLKVLTAAAALVHVPATQRATTTVLSVPSAPGTLVLRGGGDFSLTKTVAPAYTTYTKAARISTLAANSLTLLAPGVPITKIILDASYFEENGYNPAWKLSDRTNGYISPITALQLDAGRINGDLTSKKYNGTRSSTPILDAGRTFRTALGEAAKTATLEIAPTPADATTIASVNSMPMSFWLNHALMASDNTETEFIGRHAAIAAGNPSTFAGVSKTVRETLVSLGINPKALVMFDGSGLAQGDRVTAKLITQLMSRVADPASQLAPMQSYLPLAGVSGTLGGRFTGRNAVAKGFIRAKSGFIPGLYSLAGVIAAKDGTSVSFAAFARTVGKNAVGYGTRAGLDTLAARFYECGNGLTK